MWQQLTGIRNAGVERQVGDATLPADRRPRRVARMVVLNHQREAGPGEAGANILLIHHHTHAVTHTGNRSVRTCSLALIQTA